MKRRTILGVAVSVFWLVIVVAYVSLGKGWADFVSMELNSFGDFCAGVFAPLAFLWLVIGYAQQGEELAHNVTALRQQAEETANLVQQAQVQAEAIKANELHARRDTFFRYADIQIIELKVAISQAIRQTLYVNEDAKLHDDYRRLARHLAAQIKADRSQWQGSHAHPTRTFAIQRFIEIFESLLTEAHRADPSGQINKTLELGPFGDAYAAMCFANHREQKFLFRPAITGLDQLVTD